MVIWSDIWSYWLVVEKPSEKYEFVNLNDDIPNIWKNKNSCSKPPTRCPSLIWLLEIQLWTTFDFRWVWSQDIPKPPLPANFWDQVLTWKLRWDETPKRWFGKQMSGCRNPDSILSSLSPSLSRTFHDVAFFFRGIHVSEIHFRELSRKTLKRIPYVPWQTHTETFVPHLPCESL